MAGVYTSPDTSFESAPHRYSRHVQKFHASSKRAKKFVPRRSKHSVFYDSIFINVYLFLIQRRCSGLGVCGMHFWISGRFGFSKTRTVRISRRFGFWEIRGFNNKKLTKALVLLENMKSLKISDFFIVLIYSICIGKLIRLNTTGHASK
jgi:hypothetical protein